MKSQRITDVGAVMLVGMWVRLERQRKFRKVVDYYVDGRGDYFPAKPVTFYFEDGTQATRELRSRVEVRKRRPR